MPLHDKFDPIPLMSWAAEYGPLRDDYLAVDIESTGVDPHRDLPLQLGWCVVRNRKAVLEAQVLIDWSKFLTPGQYGELAVRIESTRRRMDEKAKAYPWTLEMLQDKGLQPAAAVARLASAMGSDPAVAAHYGFLFDYPMLGRLFAMVGQEFAPDVNQMYDTGLMMRACLVGVSPAWNEPLPAYAKRLNAVRCGPRHNLEASAEMMDLAADAGVKKRHCHEAGYDAWIVHLLLEKLREYAAPAKPVREVRHG